MPKYEVYGKLELDVYMHITAASKEECDNLVLDTFDTVVFHLTTGSKAMRRYMACKEKERKHNDCKYEGNKNDN